MGVTILALGQAPNVPTDMQAERRFAQWTSQSHKRSESLSFGYGQPQRLSP